MPEDTNNSSKEIKEENSCIALGVGVAGLGTAAAAVAGAVCPICFVVAPGLIGAGLTKKVLRRRKNSSTKSDSSSER
jgi:hypothetical protein